MIIDLWWSSKLCSQNCILYLLGVGKDLTAGSFGGFCEGGWFKDPRLPLKDPGGNKRSFDSLLWGEGGGGDSKHP